MLQSPEDGSAFVTVVDWIRTWGGAAFGGGGFGAAFLAGRSVQGVKGALADHGERIAKQGVEIESLKSARAAADVKIAELPTRSELATSLASMSARIESGFAMLSTLIGQRRQD
jgi:hypothetical protein